MNINESDKDIFEKFETPFYLFDIAELYARVNKIKEILGDKINLCYAMKANPFLISYLNKMVDKFEVCSPGEYEICKAEKIALSKIILSGVYKDEQSLKETFEDGFNGVYTIESREQCELLYKLAKEYNRKIYVLLRVTSGNQFGMDEEEIEAIINSEEYRIYFVLEGIHYFSGTQKKNHELIQKELRNIAEFGKYIEKKHGIAVSKIEYGPGLYVDYFGNKVDDIAEAQCLVNVIKEVSDSFEITIELGRYIAACCGKYVTKVVDIKKNHGINYAIVDGGIHQVDYYGQMLGLRVPRVTVLNKENYDIGEKENWMVCGALCTIHDVLLKNYETYSLQKGDLIIFHDTGAYSMTDTSALFLSREIPAVQIKKENGDIECLRKRQKSAVFNMPRRESEHKR